MSHPIDRLHDLRAQIAFLQLEAEIIRQRIIMGDVPLDGERYSARVRRQITLHEREENSCD